MKDHHDHNEDCGCGHQHEHEHHHGDDCGCGHHHEHEHHHNDDCGCGHHHEHEHHHGDDCGCGHHHEHEHHHNDDCGCGHHHEHEHHHNDDCGCGHHHEHEHHHNDDCGCGHHHEHEHHHNDDCGCGHQHNTPYIVDGHTHEGASVGTGALKVTGCYQELENTVKSELKALADWTTERGGIIGHIKSSLVSSHTTMLSVTEEEVNTISSDMEEVQINMAAIVFAVPLEDVKAQVEAICQKLIRTAAGEKS